MILDIFQVIAKWKEDNVWYRASVKQVSSDSYFVHFLDYGNEDYVSFHQYFKIPNCIFVRIFRGLVKFYLYSNLTVSISFYYIIAITILMNALWLMNKEFWNHYHSTDFFVPVSCLSATVFFARTN